MKHKTHAASAAVLATLLACDLAQAELVPVSWDSSGRFAHQGRVEPGKFVEVCEKLPQRTKVAWSFKATAPLDFNIHYHEGKDVKFPEKKSAISRYDGLLDVTVEQDFCWMWTNKGRTTAALDLSLTRE